MCPFPAFEDVALDTLLDANPIRYEVTNYTPVNTDWSQGEIDLTHRFDNAQIFSCFEEVSAFDDATRPCPTLTE